MKPNRFVTLLGLIGFFLLCLVPSGNAQSQLPYTPGLPSQIGISWPSVGAGSGVLGPLSVTGLQFYTVTWTVNGTVSACSVTGDGNTAPGGSFTTGSIVASQTCTSSGSFTSSTATENVQARLSYSITGTGSVIFVLRGYTENPTLASGSASNVAVTNFPNPQPVSGTVTANAGTGTFNVNCASGCGGNPDGQATMANSAPVVVASNQSAIPVSAASLPLPTGAATAANQTNVQATVGSPTSTAITVQGNASGTALPVAAASLPLPSGAATASAQTNVEAVVGSPTSTAVTVQGNASSTPLPVSGTVTANAGTGNFNTQPAGFGSIVGNEQAVTASAAALPSNAVHGFCVKALLTNGNTVYVGPSGVTTSTGYPLGPGDSICYQASNTNLAYVIASATGSSVAFSGD